MSKVMIGAGWLTVALIFAVVVTLMVWRSPGPAIAAPSARANPSESSKDVPLGASSCLACAAFNHAPYRIPPRR